jgi:hypothetical protein
VCSVHFLLPEVVKRILPTWRRLCLFQRPGASMKYDDWATSTGERQYVITVGRTSRTSWTSASHVPRPKIRDTYAPFRRAQRTACLRARWPICQYPVACASHLGYAAMR